MRAQVGLDLFCMLMCFIAAIPLGFVHARLPSATVKHVYSTVLGLAFGYLLVGGGVLHSLATCLVSYVRPSAVEYVSYRHPRHSTRVLTRFSLFLLLPHSGRRRSLAGLGFAHLYVDFLDGLPLLGPH